MHRLWKTGFTLAAVSFACSLLASESRADPPVPLCGKSGSANGVEEWSLVCAAGGTVHAEFRFSPIDETEGEAKVHVTSWGVCDESKQRIVCALEYGNNYGCFEEQTSDWIPYDGYVYGAYASCWCYDYGSSPCD